MKTNQLWWLVYTFANFNWIAGLIISNYYLYVFGMTLLIGNFLGWWGEQYFQSLKFKLKEKR